MKLNEEQIAQIEQVLICNGVIYHDIKLELLDHIASEIEHDLDESNFDTTLSEVLANWKELLKETSSRGWNYVAPKVVSDKISALIKNELKFLLAATAVFSLLMTTITTINHDEKTYTYCKLIFVIMFFLLCLTIISGLFYVCKLKSKTMYGFMFKKRCVLILYYLHIIYNYLNGRYQYRHYARESNFENYVEWFINSLFFFMAVHSILLLIEHSKIIKKYKLA